MSKFAMSIIILLVSVFISSVSQIILKTAANRTYASRIREYLNVREIISYVMFLGSTLLTMLALRYLPLSLQPILEASSYIFVSVMGYFMLKERFGKRKLIGLALILAGIFVYSVNIA